MDLLTTNEVARYLRLKERTVYDMASKRLIPCTRATGKLLFSRRLIERWIEGRTELPAGASLCAPPIYAGSSDPLLEWALRESGSGLAVLAGGSRDGLERLARGEATLAGTHLLDAEEGSYNLPAIRRVLPFPDVVAVRFAERAQGLMTAPGNPLRIHTLADLVEARPRVGVRPTDTGSRVLFDALLAREGIEPASLSLVSPEARTELDLAHLVADGEADCGLGVAAAAHRTGLDFSPLGVEEAFDLVMRRRDYFEPPVQRLLAFTRTPAFHRHAAALAGYRLDRLGEVVFNG